VIAERAAESRVAVEQRRIEKAEIGQDRYSPMAA